FGEGHAFVPGHMRICLRRHNGDLVGTSEGAILALESAQMKNAVLVCLADRGLAFEAFVVKNNNGSFDRLAVQLDYPVHLHQPSTTTKTRQQEKGGQRSEGETMMEHVDHPFLFKRSSRGAASKLDIGNHLPIVTAA